MLRQIKALFVVQVAVVMACASMSVAQQISATKQHEQEWPPSDSVELLKTLKKRDAELDYRTLEVEKRWIERVDARAELAQRRFHNAKFGMPDTPDPPSEEIPEPYDQPHRVRYRLTVREPEMTLDVVGDLEQRKHSGYGTQPNKGLRWSSAGGTERDYNPNHNTMHIHGEPRLYGVLRMYQRSMEWTCGYGFAKWMKSIDSMKVKDDHLVVTGKIQLLDEDKSTFELELDRDLIVRRAMISIPSKPNGTNEYIVETSGTVRPKKTPPLAKQGHCRRILKPVGKAESIHDDDTYVFVSITAKLGPMQYKENTEIIPKPKTSVVDLRPRKRKSPK